jgi:hypothetical protein
MYSRRRRAAHDGRAGGFHERDIADRDIHERNVSGGSRYHRHAPGRSRRHEHDAAGGILHERRAASLVFRERVERLHLPHLGAEPAVPEMG